MLFELTVKFCGKFVIEKHKIKRNICKLNEPGVGYSINGNQNFKFEI